MAKNHTIERETEKPVGIWLRVSTEDQAKGDSPQHHEKRARYYAEAKGWVVKEVYHLEGVSGKTVIEHPEAKRMLADIRRGHITGLIFSKIARLARNTTELLAFADFFQKAGADLISLQESIDTSTPAGRLFYTLNSAMATWEREEIASRVAASVPIRAKMGKSLGGRAPFGYLWKDKQFIPNQDEVPVAKLMFELFTEHKRIGTVARILNEKGFRTRVGAEWSDTTVGRLLQDPTFKGRHRLNYTTRSEKSWVIKPEADWEHIDVEPIISADVWDRCNGVLGAKEKRPRTKRAVHLFAGLAFCECGQKMYVLSNSPKYTCQGCRNKIPADDLEAVYVEQLKGFFTSSDEISSHLDKANESLAAKGELVTVKRRELEKLQKEIDRVYRLYVEEKLTGDDFTGFYKPLQDRKKSLEDETARAEAELDFMKVNRMSADEIVSEAGTLYGRWPKLSREERRSVIESITERITVGKGTEGSIDIELAYLPVQSTEALSCTNPTSVEKAVNSQRNVIRLLAFCKLALRSSKPRSSAYPKELKTIGNHLRARRLDLCLRQRDVAKKLSVNVQTVCNWEVGRDQPDFWYMPRVVEFLGYDPRPKAETKSLREELLAYRLKHGLTQRALATCLRVNTCTVSSWEGGKAEPTPECLARIRETLSA